MEPKQAFDDSEETIKKILSRMSFKHQKLVNEKPNIESQNEDKFPTKNPNGRIMTVRRVPPLKNYTGKLVPIQQLMLRHNTIKSIKEELKAKEIKSNLNLKTLQEENESANNSDELSIKSNELNKTIFVNNNFIIKPETPTSNDTLIEYKKGKKSYYYVFTLLVICLCAIIFGLIFKLIINNSNNNIQAQIPIQITSYSIANDIPIETLSNQGFILVGRYSSTTSTILTSSTNDSLSMYKILMSELIRVNKSCSIESLLCIGKALNGSKSFSLISCADCWSILNSNNYLTLINGAYWYLNKNTSFGFTSDPKDNKDVINCKSENNHSICFKLIDDTNNNPMRLISKRDIQSQQLDFINYMYLLNDTANKQIINQSTTIQSITTSLITTTFTTTSLNYNHTDSIGFSSSIKSSYTFESLLSSTPTLSIKSTTTTITNILFTNDLSKYTTIRKFSRTSFISQSENILINNNTEINFNQTVTIVSTTLKSISSGEITTLSSVSIWSSANSNNSTNDISFNYLSTIDNIKTISFDSKPPLNSSLILSDYKSTSTRPVVLSSEKFATSDVFANIKTSSKNNDSNLSTKSYTSESTVENKVISEDASSINPTLSISTIGFNSSFFSSDLKSTLTPLLLRSLKTTIIQQNSSNSISLISTTKIINVNNSSSDSKTTDYLKNTTIYIEIEPNTILRNISQTKLSTEANSSELTFLSTNLVQLSTINTFINENNSTSKQIYTTEIMKQKNENSTLSNSINITNNTTKGEKLETSTIMTQEYEYISKTTAVSVNNSISVLFTDSCSPRTVNNEHLRKEQCILQEIITYNENNFSIIFQVIFNRKEINIKLVNCDDSFIGSNKKSSYYKCADITPMRMTQVCDNFLLIDLVKNGKNYVKPEILLDCSMYTPVTTTQRNIKCTNKKNRTEGKGKNVQKANENSAVQAKPFTDCDS